MDVLGINCHPELHGLFADETWAKAIVELCGVKEIGPVLGRLITADPDVSYEHVLSTARGLIVEITVMGEKPDPEMRLRSLIYKLEDVLRDLGQLLL